MALYDGIGVHYDSTRGADPGIVRHLARLVGDARGASILDVGCGTGNYTAALAARGFRMQGVDRSARMLNAARRKHAMVRWVRADVTALPFRDASFQGAVCTLAIHHFSSLHAAFREVGRVIGQGRLVLFTASPNQLRGYWLNEYFPVAMARSIDQMPALPLVRAALGESGFHVALEEQFDVPPELRDLFLYAGKHRPALYLDPRVRANISTFSVQAEPAEIDAGCRRLADDIRTGRVAEVMASFVHGAGDYLFVVAEK